MRHAPVVMLLIALAVAEHCEENTLTPASACDYWAGTQRSNQPGPT